MTSRASRMVPATVALVVATGLSGCGADDSQPPAPSASAPVHDAHNQTDIAFAQNVIPQLAQESEIAALTDGRGGDKAKDFAAPIADEQRTRIDTVSDLLREWNAQVPDPTQSGGRFGSTPGIASPEQMHDLAGLSGPAFDDRFAELMIRHHQGTIALATNELSAGQSARLKTVARDVVNTEQHQITELQSLRAH